MGTSSFDGAAGTPEPPRGIPEQIIFERIKQKLGLDTRHVSFEQFTGELDTYRSEHQEWAGVPVCGPVWEALREKHYEHCTQESNRRRAESKNNRERFFEEWSKAKSAMQGGVGPEVAHFEELAGLAKEFQSLLDDERETLRINGEQHRLAMVGDYLAGWEPACGRPNVLSHGRFQMLAAKAGRFLGSKSGITRSIHSQWADFWLNCLWFHLLEMDSQDLTIQSMGSDAEDDGGGIKKPIEASIQLLSWLALQCSDEERVESIPSTGKAMDKARLSATVESPYAARRLEIYLQEGSIGVTNFASSAGTTDRTLRRFRETGKIKRDTLSKIADRMGIQIEELMKAPLN